MKVKSLMGEGIKNTMLINPEIENIPVIRNRNNITVVIKERN